MKKFVVLFSIACALMYGQVNVATPAIPTAKAGSTVSITLSQTSPVGQEPAGIQIITAAPYTYGVTSNVADKTAWQNVANSIIIGATADANGNVIAVNNTGMVNGNFCTLSVAIPRTEQQGPHTIPISAMYAVKPDGTPLPITFPTSLTINVNSACDVNNSGAINNGDVQAALRQANGKDACTTADINDDGKCDTSDVQAVINAVQTGVCRVNF